MADEQVQPTDEGAVEEQEPKVEGLTEEQVNAMLERRLEDNNRKWQSRFDQLLKEKKDTETKSKTAEQQIAELRQQWEQERVGRTRERVLHEANLDASLMDAMQEFLSNDDEGIKNGASQLQKYIQEKIDAGIKAGVEAEVSKRFEKAPKPQGGPQGGEMTEQEFLELTDDQLRAMGPQKVAELTRKFAGM